jgi:hypothetical protein
MCEFCGEEWDLCPVCGGCPYCQDCHCDEYFGVDAFYDDNEDETMKDGYA